MIYAIFNKWQEILKRMNDAFAFDRREVMIRTDDEVKLIQQQQMQMQEQMMARQIQEKQAEWQHESKKWMIEFKEEMLKLQHESEENQKDRLLEMLLAGLKSSGEKKETTE